MTMRSIMGGAAAVVLVSAVGCASRGTDQNYRVNEQDQPILQHETGEPHSRLPGVDATGAAGVYFVALQDDAPPPAVAPPAITTEGPGIGLDVAAVGADPSGVFNRTEWSPVVVGPADGTVWHFPLYFEDRRLGVTYNNVLEQPTVQRQLEAALESGEATFSRTNLRAGVIEPLNFALDLVLLPIRAVTTPPWTDVDSPDRVAVPVNGAVILVPPEQAPPATGEVDERAMEEMDEALEAEAE